MLFRLVEVLSRMILGVNADALWVPALEITLDIHTI